MRFNLILVIGCFVATNVVAQKASDTIDIKSINNTFLEELSLQQVNKVRSKAGSGPLAPHDVLYKAAEDQINYIKQLGKTSHNQPDPQKASARKRVGYYGGDMSGIGENAAGFTLLKPTRMPIGTSRDSILTVFTYQQAAEVLVELWYGSPVHNTNMLNPNYQLSGLCLRYDAKTSMLFAIHVLAYE